MKIFFALHASVFLTKQFTCAISSSCDIGLHLENLQIAVAGRGLRHLHQIWYVDRHWLTGHTGWAKKTAPQNLLEQISAKPWPKTVSFSSTLASTSINIYAKIYTDIWSSSNAIGILFMHTDVTGVQSACVLHHVENNSDVGQFQAH